MDVKCGAEYSYNIKEKKRTRRYVRIVLIYQVKTRATEKSHYHVIIVRLR